MQTVQVPWSAWYNERKFELTFPDSWRLSVADMKGGPDIGDAGVRAALANPIGAPPLRELAQGRRSAAILVDDLSRPTPAYRLLPYVLEELAAADINADQIRIIGALAAHRPMTREDFVKKVGEEIVERYFVTNHNAYENLDFLGHSSRGVPVFINRDFMACEVRIAMGMITPRGNIFGGGSKLVLPGASGHTTILANHRYIHDGFRAHLDEVAGMAGLNYIVNPLLNPELEIMALVAGHPVEAYWHGVSLGKELYATAFPKDVDVAVFNAFPKDTELLQAGMGMVPLWTAGPDKLKKEATVVIASASPEGLGWHSVFGPGTALGGQPRKPPWRTIIFSPGVNRYDVRTKFDETVTFCKTWPEVLKTLNTVHGDGSHVAVFPSGATQYCGPAE